MKDELLLITTELFAIMAKIEVDIMFKREVSNERQLLLNKLMCDYNEQLKKEKANDKQRTTNS